MSLEYEMKPKRRAIQTLVELRITPLNLARVGQPKQPPSTNLSLMKPLCVSLKRVKSFRQGAGSQGQAI